MKSNSTCTNCLYQSNTKFHICPQCKAEQIVYRENKKIMYLDRSYSVKEWYYLNASFRVLSAQRIVTKQITLPQNPVYIKHLYEENVNMYTRIGIRFVWMFFIFISIVISSLLFLIQNTTLISLADYSIQMGYFLCSLLFILGMFLLIYTKRKQLHVVLTQNRKQVQWKYISDHELKTNIRMFDHLIENQISQHNFFPKICGNKVCIRLLNRRDIKQYHQFMSNANVAKYMSWYPIENIEASKTRMARIFLEYQKEELFHLAISLSTGNFIGIIGLSKYDLTEKTCQIIYAIDEPYWRKGYTQEALELFIEYLFTVKKKETIIATHIKDNIASGKVMKKCGFIRTPSRDTTMIIKGKEEELLAYTIERRLL